MLIAARDEDGRAKLFSGGSDKEPCALNDSKTMWLTTVYGLCVLGGDEAEPFCRNIPPGEKRVIDLEKSTIVHVATPKTPVEELVEITDRLLGDVTRLTHLTGSIGFETARRIILKTADETHSALARVKEEANAK